MSDLSGVQRRRPKKLERTQCHPRKAVSVKFSNFPGFHRKAVAWIQMVHSTGDTSPLKDTGLARILFCTIQVIYDESTEKSLQ